MTPPMDFDLPLRCLFDKGIFVACRRLPKTRKEDDMAFKDFFLPKIAHSNPEIRKKAIRKETNANLLKRVIDNDEDPSVVKTAEKRIRELRA